MEPGGIDKRGLGVAVSCELNWKLPPRLSAIQRLGHQLPAPAFFEPRVGPTTQGAL